MSLKDKVFQMFVCGSGEMLDYALSNNLGGVIFFTRDIHSREQFCSLIKAIKNKSKTPPFLSIDQEGGRVERTKNIHSGYFSPKEAYKRGELFLKEQTKSILLELQTYGLNMNFAPCLDVNSNPNNPIIGDRAFSDKPKDVCNGFDCTASIYKKGGIIPVVKHFPGHGDASKDSHKELPQITLPMEEMQRTHIRPFKYAIDKGIDVIMAAHLHCTCFDETEIPTSLSKNCLDYLRNILKFDGIIISDDMFMKGVAKYGMTEACLMGINAGLNMFIYRDTTHKTVNTIEDIIRKAEKDTELKEKINDSFNKITKLKYKYGIL